MSTTPNTIEIGDTVRSHDFPDRLLEAADPSRPACYVEGVVEAITDPQTHPRFTDCPRYVIRATARVFAGKILPRERWGGDCFYPPVNGTPTWLGRVTNGVEKVDA